MKILPKITYEQVDKLYKDLNNNHLKKFILINCYIQYLNKLPTNDKEVEISIYELPIDGLYDLYDKLLKIK